MPKACEWGHKDSFNLETHNGVQLTPFKQSTGMMYTSKTWWLFRIKFKNARETLEHLEISIQIVR